MVALTTPANGSATNQDEPTFSGPGRYGRLGTCPTVTVRLYSGSSVSGSPAQTPTATASGGAWAVAASSALPEGTYTAQASQSDDAGEYGHEHTGHVFRGNSPAAGDADGAPANGETTNHSTPTFSGTAGTTSGDLPTVTVKVYTGSTATGTPVQTLTTTAFSGAWSVTAFQQAPRRHIYGSGKPV